MTLNPETITQKTLELLTGLVKEIGPRPAGSAAEKHAHDWLEGQFQSAGLKTMRFPVKYQADPLFFPYYTVAAAGFAIVALTIGAHGWTTLLLPLLILALPELMMGIQGKLLPYRDGSSNLLALTGATRPQELDVIFCAHVDTARAVPYGPREWKKWRDKSIYIMMRVANILIIPGILQFMGMDITGLFLDISRWVAWSMAFLLLIQDIWEAVVSIGKYSPGANDNGSGTALLAAAALETAANPLEKLKAGFLFTGAEETGLHGARQFATYMKENNMSCPVIGVDMVGAGSGMRITTQCGTIRPVKADSALNELIKRADPLAVYHAIPRRWGDFVPFAQAGIPATHLENVGTPDSWASYHTPKDTLDTIDDEMLRHMSEVITQLMWILEKEKH